MVKMKLFFDQQASSHPKVGGDLCCIIYKYNEGLHTKYTAIHISYLDKFAIYLSAWSTITIRAK